MCWVKQKNLQKIRARLDRIAAEQDEIRGRMQVNEEDMKTEIQWKNDKISYKMGVEGDIDENGFQRVLKIVKTVRIFQASFMIQLHAKA